MRKNHKGFTLVELIIAVAILSIVTLAVCGFIVVGSRSYTSANTDVMLQQEAQLALNQISDVIIDTTDSINYGGKSDSASEMEMVLKDSEFSEEPTEKCLVVVNKKASNNDNPSYWFSWNKAEEVIYFNTSDDVVDESNPEPHFVDADKAVLAQHVKEFHVDISQFEQNRVVMVSMTFANGGREYTTSNNITVRNRVSLNKIDVKPMKRATEMTINTVSSVTLEPGEHYTFLYTVEGSDEDKAVRWELAGTAKNGTSISSDGALSIGLEETRQSFTVRVTRAAYADAKTTKEVRVNVKRVTDVNLSCASTSIEAGDTITVNGNVVGNLLGNRCDAYGCAADDPAKDRDLTGWTVVSGPAVLTASDSDSADIKINTDAKSGDEIIVEAASDLSARKGYGPKSAPTTPPVKGRIVLKVTKGEIGDTPLKSKFKFGTDNDPGPIDKELVDEKENEGASLIDEYVCCVRVREMDSNTRDNDQVVLYYTGDRKDVRFNPDLFGLELNRSYYVFIQLLSPISKINLVRGDKTHDSDEDIKNEYLANLDPRGKYIGDKYYASKFYYGILSPPSIAITCNGVSYPNEDPNCYERYSFVSGNSRVMEKICLDDKRTTNVDINKIGSGDDCTCRIYYTLYKGDGDDISQWTRICGYNRDTLQCDSNEYTTPGGAISFNLKFGADPTAQRISNKNWQLACGTYHIVTGYEYSNDPNIRGGYKYLYKHNLRGDYETHYYEQPDCTITLKIDTGMNLELPSENGEQIWTNFPIPTDKAFPFELKKYTTQSIVHNFTKYKSNGNNAGSLDNIVVECKYVPGVSGSADSYTIILSDKQFDGTQIKTHIYGKYTCKVGKDVWDRINGPSDTTEPLNLTFTKNGNTYITYFPAPGESGFPFAATSGEQTDERYLTMFNKYNTNDKHAAKCMIKATYSGGVYSVTLSEIENTSAHKRTIYTDGIFTYNGSTWQSDGTAKASSIEAVWKPRIYFHYNGNDCMMEFPLPSDSDFPQFSGNEYTENSSKQYFLASDTYGEDVWKYTYQAVTVKYTYDESSQTYTVKLYNTWNESDSYGTWKCAKTGATWDKIH